MRNIGHNGGSGTPTVGSGGRVLGVGGGFGAGGVGSKTSLSMPQAKPRKNRPTSAVGGGGHGGASSSSAVTNHGSSSGKTSSGGSGGSSGNLRMKRSALRSRTGVGGGSGGGVGSHPHATAGGITRLLSHVIAFLLGSMACTSVIMLFHGTVIPTDQIGHWIHDHTGASGGGGGGNSMFRAVSDSIALSPTLTLRRPISNFGTDTSISSSSLLTDLRILVVIAAYDFSQLPHMEELLDSYRDLCEAGSHVDLYIHATQPYPVTLIDLLNSRLKCLHPRGSYNITIALKSPGLRLNLVDCHRSLFYEKIDEYDVFLYSEDDIRVTPTTVAAYLHETRRIESLVKSREEASNYNVGIVRYEYNYPPDVVIDDKTRHATEKTTRVYWEHVKKPLIPSAIDLVEPKHTVLRDKYVYMTNHHQGMYLATRDLLKAWKTRPNCQFDVIRQRPGKGNQPTAGTQRVWMSSHMLYSKRHCNVQQVIPVDRLGELTLHHLPNKNYRRVGRQGRLGGAGKDNAPPNEFGSKGDTYRGADSTLVSEMEFHLELRKNFPTSFPMPPPSSDGYGGVIRMINEIDRKKQFRGKGVHEALVAKRMKQYEEYVKRGGMLSDADIREAEMEIEQQRTEEEGADGDEGGAQAGG